MNYEQKKSLVTVREDRFSTYVGDWRYSKRGAYSINLKTGEIFHGSLDELLIEKRFIDKVQVVDLQM